MVAIANLVLKDGQATPVSHTFSPFSTDGSSAEWRERGNGVPFGQPSVKLTVRAPAPKGSVYKVSTTLNIPKVVQDMAGSSKIARETRVNLELLAPVMGDKQERKDIRMELIDLLQSPQFVAAWDDLESAY